MDNPRLLTDEELRQVEKSRGWWELQTRKAVMSAQDQKTAALVKAETLREVGEWLGGLSVVIRPLGENMYLIGREVSDKDIDALSRCEMPGKE